MSDAKPTILAIDDAEGVRRLLEVTLGKSQVVKTAPDAHSALAWAQLATPPDLVLLDTEPAGMSGYELCKALRAMPGFTEVPVIFLAERRDPQELVRGYSLGALDFLVKPLAAPVLLQRIRGHLEHLARERAGRLQGAELRIARLVRAMQLHERSLGGNRAQRLSQYARALAQAAGAREVAADLLAKAAPVHDVGKLAVPPELLHSERTLAGAEREQFERHAAIGAEIIGEHDDALLKLARTLALTHHEYWDGTGFPGRLEGNQIPWTGRVMGIVDAFESATAAQYGGSRMSTDKAVDEITAGAGTQFDPALVEALRKAAAEFRKVHGAYPERAADAGDDLVIGAASARSPAAKPAPAAAAADDLVLGAPARDPVDKGALTKMAPPRPGAGAASSDRIREAIQRAAAKAQRPAAPPPPEARPPAAEKPAAVPLDLQLGESAPTMTPARSPARGELEALRARVSELEAELQEARGEVQIRTNELEATRAALAQARAELERAREQPVVELPASQGELQQAQTELESTQVALSAAQAELERARAQAVAASAASQGKLQQARAELEALNAQLAGLLSERTTGDAALAGASTELQQAHAELERTRAEVAALRQSQAEIERLRNRIRELETERSTTVAALLQARAEGERARAELRGRPVATEQPQSQAEIAGLRSRVKELETEREHARAEIAKLSDSERQLEAELVRSDAARSDVHAQLEHAEAARAELEGLRKRVNELESEREQSRAELEGLRAAADVTQEPRSAEAADAESRLAEIQRALDELQRRREDAEATLTALQARVADAQAELETQTERVRLAAEEAPAAPLAAVAPVAAPRPIATLLVVAFLFGALAMGVTFLLFHP